MILLLQTLHTFSMFPVVVLQGQPHTGVCSPEVWHLMWLCCCRPCHSCSPLFKVQHPRSQICTHAAAGKAHCCSILLERPQRRDGFPGQACQLGALPQQCLAAKPQLQRLEPAAEVPCHASTTSECEHRTWEYCWQEPCAGQSLSPFVLADHWICGLPYTSCAWPVAWGCSIPIRHCFTALQHCRAI